MDPPIELNGVAFGYGMFNVLEEAATGQNMNSFRSLAPTWKGIWQHLNALTQFRCNCPEVDGKPVLTTAASRC